LAQFRELEAFAKFGSDLDKATLAQLTRGERMVEILKQNQYVPMSIEQQVAIIFAGGKGLLDDIPNEKVKEFEKGLVEYIVSNHSSIFDSIKSSGEISDDVSVELIKAIEDYKQVF
jgi:F-type H+-transporting ATPase subunit alpha